MAGTESYDNLNHHKQLSDRRSNVEDVLLTINRRRIDKSNIQSSIALINLNLQIESSNVISNLKQRIESSNGILNARIE